MVGGWLSAPSTQRSCQTVASAADAAATLSTDAAGSGSARRGAGGRTRPSHQRTRVRQPAGGARHPVLLRPRLHPGRSRLRPRRRRPGGGCAGRRASARARRPPGAGRVGPRGDGPGGGRVLRRPDEPPAHRRGHRDERQDDERVPRTGAAGGRRPPDRPAGDGQERDRQRRARCPADDPGGDRPAAHVPGDGRCRRPGMRDGGLLSRAGAATRRRDPFRRRALHQPHPGPPRLPSHDGGLLQRQAAAVLRSRASASVGRQRRRPLRGAARRRARPARHVRAARRARRLPRHERADRPRWLDVHRGHAR